VRHFVLKTRAALMYRDRQLHKPLKQPCVGFLSACHAHLHASTWQSGPALKVRNAK